MIIINLSSFNCLTIKGCGKRASKWIFTSMNGLNFALKVDISKRKIINVFYINNLHKGTHIKLYLNYAFINVHKENIRLCHLMKRDINHVCLLEKRNEHKLKKKTDLIRSVFQYVLYSNKALFKSANENKGLWVVA